MRKLLLLGAALVLSAIPFTALGQETHDDAADYAVSQQIMYPDFDGQFNPAGNVTRLEFVLATVDHLYPEENFDGCFDSIASSQPALFTRLFADVRRDEWYAKHLCVAMRAGLIQGDKDGNFLPFRNITTAEASKILARAYGLLYPSMSVTGKPWYEGPMLALRIRGAIGDVSPDSKLLRDGMAVMFYALRDTERFPETRIIGVLQEASPVVASAEGPARLPPEIVREAPSAPALGQCPVTPVTAPGMTQLDTGMGTTALLSPRIEEVGCLPQRPRVED